VIPVDIQNLVNLKAIFNWHYKSIPGRSWEFFSSPLCWEQLWGPPSLLFNGYRRFFPRG